MAKLVEIYRNDKHKLSKRQLPLVVDENLTMVMDMNSMGFVYDNPSVRGKELDKFLDMYNSLTPQEVRQAFQVNCKELLSILSQMIPCVGCRRSVERLFYQLVKSGHPALDPLRITPDGILTIQDDHFSWPHLLCTLLHGHSDRLDQLIESQLRSKKSRRCILHSLDSQRVRGPWKDVWDVMKPHCREEVLVIDSSALMSTLESYLHRHRFCSDCRTKVLRAYWLLVEEPEPNREKGYVPALYAGIKRCLPDKHIHLPSSTDYISALVSRVQPDIMGSGGERHAKTLEIAQGEVITCLGLCVYERLQKIQLRLREEETTCQVLAAVAIEALSRKFQTSVDFKRGATKLDLLFKELAKEEMVKQQRKEQKKLKRKKRKEKRAGLDSKKEGVEGNSDETCPNSNFLEDESVDSKDDKLNDMTSGFCFTEFESDSRKIDIDCSSNDSDECKLAQECIRQSSNPMTCQSCTSQQSQQVERPRWTCETSHDCGYSSGNNNVSSSPSSPEGSDVACCEGLCNDEALCARDEEVKPLTSENGKNPSGKSIFSCNTNKCLENGRLVLSLQEMLEDCSSSEEEGYIPAEEIREFKSKDFMKKRQELRETLRTRFARFCQASESKY